MTGPRILSLLPSATEIAVAVGAALDAAAEAEASVRRLQAGLEAIRTRSAARGWRPRVAAIEWIELLMAARN
jgi:iron complex transport system substrate-binding protein